MKAVMLAMLALFLASYLTNLIKIYLPRTYRIMEIFNWNAWAERLEGTGHGTAAMLLKGTCYTVFTFGFGLIEIAILQNF